MTEDSRYIVISSDCHGGADLPQYRDYLDARYQEDFDRWAAGYEIPYEDMKGEQGSRNWDTERRERDLRADGIVAEVMYPNTVPPFFPTSSLASSQAPVVDAEDFRYRSAGLRAHNRWLADFCSLARGRRAGVFQVMLQDVAEAVKEVEWAVRAGLTGGVLLPGAPPGSGLPPLYYHDYYQPFWDICAELNVPVNCHSGGSGPRTGDRPQDDMFFLLEMKWWDQRTMRHLILGGVLERNPGINFVFTESGAAWIPRELKAMDAFHAATASQRGKGNDDVTYNGSQPLGDLSMTPSEYWYRQCYAGASFMHPAETKIRHSVGVGNIMWGSDYPHVEASFPYSKEAIGFCFAGTPEAEVGQMLGGNAAKVYGFSLPSLRPLADQAGPLRPEVTAGVDPAFLPAEAAKCPAFAGAMPGSATTQMGDNRATRERA